MDHQTFRDIFDKAYMPLCMYALRILPDTDAADEAVQRAFIALWERASEGCRIDNPRAYLYRITRNEALRLMPASIPLDTDLSAVDITDETIDTSERDAALWQAIDSLPRRCREIFLAAKRDGMSHAEIAAEMGISVKTVEAQMTKALGRLRSALQPYSGHRRPFFLPFL